MTGPAGETLTALRVLHLTSSFPRHATDHVAPFLLDLARAQRAAGLEVRVLAPHDAGAARATDIDGIGVRRFRYAPSGMEVLAYRGGLMGRVRTRAVVLLPFFLLTFAAGACWQVLRWRPDVVHAHWWLPAGVCGLPAARLLRRPLVITLHGSDARLLSLPVIGALGRRVLRAADLVAVVSTDLGRVVESTVLPDRLTELVLPVATAPDVVRPLPPAPPVRLLAAGRLSREKGFDVLVRAVDRAVADGHDLRLTLVGDGPERAALLALAAPLGDRVQLLGAMPRAALWALMDEAHAVVVPSRREGLGLVAAEAMARGRPVVASQVGGLPELFGSADAGLLVPSEDVAALASALAQLPLSAPVTSLPAPEGTAGRRDPVAVGRAHAEAYAQLCARRSGR